jgi:hypothetical protein
MKQIDSETSTALSKTASATGTQLGAHGSAMRGNLETLSEEKVERGLAWLRRLPALQPTALPEKETVLRIQSALMTSASGVWISARVAALLSPYYEKDIPQAVRKMEAEDWEQALSGFPQWAIERAVRWWKSDANTDRRKRPLEGDIAARCRVEMDGVASASKVLEMKQRGAEHMPEPRERLTADRAAEIMRDVGFGVKRME